MDAWSPNHWTTREFPHVPFDHLYIFFGEMSIWILCPFYNLSFFVFLSFFFLVVFLLYSSYRSFIRYMFSNIFSHSVDCLHLLDGVLRSTNVFNFDEIQFICFLFVCFFFCTCAFGKHCLIQDGKDLLQCSYIFF